ncbi:hypothetical protein Clacol_002002 [Clathrus columnatus]|uniref:Partial AB-hydrolase lipase domain-containing protein n=1 Tax=Clathrus columnatus TaxID=1419009 RepID=A0AAV5A2X4_9AGAM|nr:hypothetical protein Clacol_002002 [Clathrus columnatus]
MILSRMNAAASQSLAVPKLRSYGSTERIPLDNSNNSITVTAALSIPSSARAIIPSTRSNVSVIPSLHTDPPPSFQSSLRSRLALCIAQTFATIISSTFLICVTFWATAVHFYRRIPAWLRPVEPRRFEWDNPQLAKTEKVVKQVYAYAQAVNFEIIDEQVETADGYFLRVHRIVNPRHKPSQHGKGGFPVLILHGLFQSSGSFITSEERSLAFWLSEQGGYQVFLGNTRAVFNMGHRTLSRSDPRFWNWTIKDLAAYDFPALVDYVRDATGYNKIAFIGHSQGNGLAFISLSEGMHPELGEKLSCFIALAPAVYAGHLTESTLFRVLKSLEWNTWRKIFGVLDFIPIMQISYNYVPAKIFASMGYVMFAYLFNWTDANWLPRRKTKMFRFLPTPVSSASIFWWCGKGGFAERGCTMDDTRPTWWTIWTEAGLVSSLPPLSLWSGGKDYLVDVKKLIKRLREKENSVTIMRIEEIEHSEHCDFYWAAESVEWCFFKILGKYKTLDFFVAVSLKFIFPEDIEYTRGNSKKDITSLPSIPDLAPLMDLN